MIKYMKEKNHKKPEHAKEESKEQEYLEGWQRARADLENLQKRTQIEKQDYKSFLKRDMAEALIPLADNFRSLVAHAPDANKDPWVAGVTHVARQFEQNLTDFGIEIIENIGEAFDPAIHEAVGEEEKEGQEGKVLAVTQAGYKIGDVIIRPAKVTVGVDPLSHSGRGHTAQGAGG